MIDGCTDAQELQRGWGRARSFSVFTELEKGDSESGGL